MIKKFAQFFGCLLVLVLVSTPKCWANEVQRTARKPNVVFILADDLGWKDLGCQGSTFYETPHIDGLAQQGVRFTQAYAACSVCSPTRASILTGRYPARLHLTDWLPGQGSKPTQRLLSPSILDHLPTDELTLAEAFHQGGYVTAIIGKWHLGGKNYRPTRYGFDLNIAGARWDTLSRISVPTTFLL